MLTHSWRSAQHPPSTRGKGPSRVSVSRLLLSTRVSLPSCEATSLASVSSKQTHSWHPPISDVDKMSYHLKALAWGVWLIARLWAGCEVWRDNPEPCLSSRMPRRRRPAYHSVPPFAPQGPAFGSVFLGEPRRQSPTSTCHNATPSLQSPLPGTWRSTESPQSPLRTGSS